MLFLLLLPSTGLMQFHNLIYYPSFPSASLEMIYLVITLKILTYILNIVNFSLPFLTNTKSLKHFKYSHDFLFYMFSSIFQFHFVFYIPKLVIIIIVLCIQLLCTFSVYLPISLFTILSCSFLLPNRSVFFFSHVYLQSFKCESGSNILSFAFLKSLCCSILSGHLAGWRILSFFSQHFESIIPLFSAIVHAL